MVLLLRTEAILHLTLLEYRCGGGRSAVVSFWMSASGRLSGSELTGSVTKPLASSSSSTGLRSGG